MTPVQIIFSVIGALGTIAGLIFAWIKHRDSKNRTRWADVSNASFSVDQKYIHFRNYIFKNCNNSNSSTIRLSNIGSLLSASSRPDVEIKKNQESDRFSIEFNIPPATKLSLDIISSINMLSSEPTSIDSRLEQVFISKFREFDKKNNEIKYLLFGAWMGFWVGIIFESVRIPPG